jgi:hypothetical protein
VEPEIRYFLKHTTLWFTIAFRPLPPHMLLPRPLSAPPPPPAAVSAAIVSVAAVSAAVTIAVSAAIAAAFWLIVVCPPLLPLFLSAPAVLA